MFAHICAVFAHGRIAMIEAISCGGVVIFRGKILLLYKNYRDRKSTRLNSSHRT